MVPGVFRWFWITRIVSIQRTVDQFVNWSTVLNLIWWNINLMHLIKGLTTWWVSTRAEISLRPPGWNIVVIACSICAWKFTEVRKHSQCACLRSCFGPDWNSVSITWDFFRFSAQTELHPGLNPSPCNRQFGFQRICFRSRSEISAWDEIRHVIRPLIKNVIF